MQMHIYKCKFERMILYSSNRTIFELISSKVKYFTHLQDKQKLFWILNCEELDILNSLGTRFLQISLP